MKAVSARSRVTYTQYLPWNEESKFGTRCCVKSLVTVYRRLQLEPGGSWWQMYQSTPNLSRHLLGTSQAVSLFPDNFAVLAAFDIDSPCESKSSDVFSIYY